MKKSEGKFVALTYKDFRLYLITQFISSIGTQMQIVALNWHIYLLTGSAVALGLIGLMRFIPIIVFALIGGTLADRYDRKKIQLITQVLLAVQAFILAYTTFNNTVTPTIIYIITLLSAATAAFDMPARQAFVPNLVDKKHVPNAMSLNVIMWQTATIMGPGISGFIIAKYGVGSVYLINAVSYIALIAALFFIATSGKVANISSTLSWHSIREGLSYTRHTTILWSTMVLDFFSTFFAAATTMLPIFAKDILHVGPQGLGLLYAAPSIGAVIAGFIMTHWANNNKQGIILLASVTMYALATILFGISTTFSVSLFALMLIGAGDGVSTIIRHTIRQLETPDHLRGRMTGVNMLFVMGGPQLGEFEAGMLTALIGAQMSVVSGGIGTLIVVVLMALYVPTLKNYTQTAR